MVVSPLKEGLSLPEANMVFEPKTGRRAYFYAGENFQNTKPDLRPIVDRLNTVYGGEAPEGLRYSTMGSFDSGQTTGAIILRNTKGHDKAFFTFQHMNLKVPREPRFNGLFSRGMETVPTLHVVTIGVDPKYRGYHWAGRLTEMAIEGLQREGLQVKYAVGITHKPETVRSMENTDALGDVFPYASSTFYRGHPRELMVARSYVDEIGLSDLLDPETASDTMVLRGVHGKHLDGNHTDTYNPRMREIDGITVHRMGVNKDAGDSVVVTSPVLQEKLPGYLLEGESPQFTEYVAPVAFSSHQPFLMSLYRLFNAI